ncbi:MAG: glycerol-3-phosphate ABC transporter ATP-binding protein [Rhizobiales bacterium 17-65-6]|nr:MAG: glycerol-3-phosphate ABC transporter ATP-binding protein [Rhizobiales bacterium 12-68-15]OYX90064.1 MAG: glycerol-3-phosphate ABC transporter ATP-binding protein [Azorhizobium sp. 32-67-21]OYY12900.1 MAG: glycerol-3-phosphate ABC transporter ATP-binding protein [Rhizobiales bacterium 35-68-8]OYZ99774.1 MAG: glycerol-3-phosphate ABC transporter ATP-binding protein [Rhizobiales bacterium 17-65-6]OZA91924.1 MAG: glycerol-3-phosphate ABC transporter ATP-binding protein [Azorhizobium sp. 39-
MAEVRLKQVRKAYGAAVAVHGVDLDIRDGEFVVFLGPSGCGKSTTLRMIAGLEEITTGTVEIGGRDVTRLEPKDRNIAMVFQNYALYPHKTIYENLAFGLRMRKMERAEIDRRVRSASTMLGLDPYLERKPKQLSGGQMQRVALGRALVRDPDVFLLDEPLSNLDAKLRVRMREEIARLHQEVGTSMVYVTHDQVEAMTLANRILIMRDGHVQQVGAPLEVYDRPANLFVAGFIGSPEMNLVDGHIAGTVARCGALSVPLPPDAGAAEGSEVVLGIRPEHVTVAEGPGARPFHVAVIEQLGAQTLCIGDVDGVRLKVLMDRSDAVRHGTTLPVQFRPERLHVFLKQTGLRVNRAGAREGQRPAA